MVEHLRLDVDHVEPPSRAELRRHVQGLQPGAGADLEDPFPGAGAQAIARGTSGKTAIATAVA
ncbi:hypothetical protein GCM10023195_52550 [Actinoallomurus liliacearum]|uniref:Uncharacterized protein n=1 Tax=Actinoallomurus liliacearum TaxID=1080073 RepID=A0ABP8TQ58_9ACTN